MSGISINKNSTHKPRSRGGRRVRETYETRMLYKALQAVKAVGLNHKKDSLEKSDSQVLPSKEAVPQSCYIESPELSISDTDLGYHELTSLEEFQEFFEASQKRAEALAKLKKIIEQKLTCKLIFKNFIENSLL